LPTYKKDYNKKNHTIIHIRGKKYLFYLATISFSFNEAAPKTLEAVAIVMK